MELTFIDLSLGVYTKSKICEIRQANTNKGRDTRIAFERGTEEISVESLAGFDDNMCLDCTCYIIRINTQRKKENVEIEERHAE